MLTAVGNVRRPSPDTEIVRLSFDVVNEATSPPQNASAGLVASSTTESRNSLGKSNLKAARSPLLSECATLPEGGSCLFCFAGGLPSNHCLSVQQSVELLQFISRWALAPVEFAAFPPKEPDANAFRLMNSTVS